MINKMKSLTVLTTLIATGILNNGCDRYGCRYPVPTQEEGTITCFPPPSPEQIERARSQQIKRKVPSNRDEWKQLYETMSDSRYSTSEGPMAVTMEVIKASRDFESKPEEEKNRTLEEFINKTGFEFMKDKKSDVYKGEFIYFHNLYNKQTN